MYTMQRPFSTEWAIGIQTEYPNIRMRRENQESVSLRHSRLHGTREGTGAYLSSLFGVKDLDPHANNVRGLAELVVIQERLHEVGCLGKGDALRAVILPKGGNIGPLVSWQHQVVGGHPRRR